jgi:hypothetical protein
MGYGFSVLVAKGFCLSANFLLPMLKEENSANNN